MWGFEMFGKKTEKQSSVSRAEQVVSVPPGVQTEAAAVIAKAKLMGDAHISNPHNPNQYGAEHAVGPRTEVRRPTPVSKAGTEELHINPDVLEQSLENPTELGGSASVKPADVLQSAARAESLYADPKQVEAALAVGKLPEAIAIKKVPWQPDMFIEPKARPLSSTPMGTAADLRSEHKPVGVESDWQAAKRTAEAATASTGLGVCRVVSKTTERPASKRETAGTGLSETRKAELRRNAERLILDLQKLIAVTKDATELKSMRARLALAETFYDENFK